MKKISKICCTSLLVAYALVGCNIRQADTSAKEQVVTDKDAAAVPEATVAPGPKSEGFNINSFEIVNPVLGKFPYFSLIEGYQPVKDSQANKNVDFDRYEFFDGAKLIPVEGRLATIYAINKDGKGPAAFKIMKTYESLVKKLGGGKVFEGKNYERYSRGFNYTDPRHRQDHKTKSEFGVYAVRLHDKEIWVEVFVENYSDDDYYLTVVEKKNLEVKAGLLTADEMKKEIEAAGHVALYINFDFDKSDIKPDSFPIIDEIVRLLKDNPELNLTIEGHTDNVGKPDYNKKLSDKRAKAVASAIIGKGIKADRLKSVGFGQDKPIADNSTEEGRTANRRVELVKIG